MGEKKLLKRGPNLELIRADLIRKGLCPDPVIGESGDYLAGLAEYVHKEVCFNTSMGGIGELLNYFKR